MVGPGVRTGMPILYDKPQEVGADRIVNAIAAYERTHDTTIVVDFGTATTFDYVSPKGEYVGGVIAPGLGISSDALFERAAKLYRVELAKPKHVVGRNTVHAIQSGLIYGYVVAGRWPGRAHPKGEPGEGAGHRHRRLRSIAGAGVGDHRRGRRVPDAGRPALDLRTQL